MYLESSTGGVWNSNGVTNLINYLLNELSGCSTSNVVSVVNCCASSSVIGAFPGRITMATLRPASAAGLASAIWSRKKVMLNCFRREQSLSVFICDGMGIKEISYLTHTKKVSYT